MQLAQGIQVPNVALRRNLSIAEQPFNPLSRNERLLFEVLLVGEHALPGWLIAKVPRPRRWRVSHFWRMNPDPAIKRREIAYPSLFASAA